VTFRIYSISNPITAVFVRPEQIAEIGKRHPGLGRLRLVVTRDGEIDVMILKA
jgi:phenylacetate-CoA ligase